MTAQKRLTLIGIFLAFFLFVSVLTGFFGLTHRLLLSDASALWLSRIELWVIAGIICLYAQKVEQSRFLFWTEEKKGVVFFVVSILLILTAITILLPTISMLEKGAGYTSNNKVVNSMLETLCGNKLLLVFTCLTAAFTEEFIFRGYLLPRFQLLFNNKWVAIILSSLLFGLAHFGFSDFNRVLFAFIIGLIFSWYYFKYNSLTILIICHFLMDLYSTYGACS